MREIDFLCKPPLIAHRGFFDNNNGIPENSIIAFKRAIDCNYSIEFDVHLLKDGNIIVFHDDNLNRMTGIDKSVKNCTYDEIKNLKLLDTNQTIPLLKDVLNLIDGKVTILIELKYDVKVGLLEEKLLKILREYNGKYAVQSFNPKSVYWFKKNAPNIIRGQLSCSFTKTKMSKLKRYFMSNMIFNCITKPDFISYNYETIDKILPKIKNGMKLLVWTVRNKETYEKNVKYCNNLICEKFDFIK